AMNPLKALERFGQSVWIDAISRQMIQSGQLRRLIDEDGLSGLTSNPTIFDKAISESSDYDASVRDTLRSDAAQTDDAVFQSLAVEDITAAADVLRFVYDATEGADGFVSLEVSPHLAHDSEGSIAEARRLWRAVNRPNLMIKIPATDEGMVAIE